MSLTLSFATALLAAVFTTLLGMYAWGHRRVAGATSFAILMVALAFYSVTYSMTAELGTLAAKLWWAKLGYIGVLSAAAAWLSFALVYTGHEAWLTGRRIALALVIPIITLALVFTNERHGLIWPRVWLAENIQVSHGSWYWVNVIYCNGLVLSGMVLLVKVVLNAQRPFRKQAAAILFGGVSIWGWQVLYAAGVNRVATQYTPLAVCLSALIFAWGLFRFRLLEIVPIARETVIENMRDAMIVLDPGDQIVDLNPATQKILGGPASRLVGTPIAQALPEWPAIAGAARLAPDQPVEMALGTRERRDYELRISQLHNRRGSLKARLVVLNDITQRKYAERAEHEQRALAEALCDTAAALNSTLHLDEVFDRILTNLSQVVPHDTVNIMVVEEEVARLARCHGYSGPGILDTLMALRLPLAEVPNLARMAETGLPLTIPDVTTFPGWVTVKGTEWIRSYASAPIRYNGEIVGFLNLDSATPGFYQPGHGERLMAFAGQAAIAIGNARLYAEMQQLALTDGMTGVYNRRALFDLGRREVERAHRFNRPLAALMVDLDHLKTVNDTYGHLIGDQVLRALVDCCQENVRTVDTIGRYGGDEFVILLPENDLQTAAQVAERLRVSIGEMRVLVAGELIRVSVSVGLATLDETIPDLAGLIGQADRALYRAKEEGRNRVRCPAAVPDCSVTP